MGLKILLALGRQIHKCVPVYSTSWKEKELNMTTTRDRPKDRSHHERKFYHEITSPSLDSVFLKVVAVTLWYLGYIIT